MRTSINLELNMAEVNNKTWWSSWLTAAKDKSLEALDATKRDLSEFVNVVQRDTSTAVNDVANKVISIVNQDDGSDEDGADSGTPPTSTSSSAGKSETRSTIYDRNQAELESIRSDPDTFCKKPEEVDEEWSSNFDSSKYQDEISKLLVNSSSVRKLHSELVPAKVSYESFWHNYFFKIHLMEVAEAKRAEIMARAHSQGQLICWDEDDDHGTGDTGTGDVGAGDTGTGDIGAGDTGAGDIGTEDIGTGRAMTDSSDSFICINEETIKDIEDSAALNSSKDGTAVVVDKDSLPSDDDWEKWDDND